jgi:nucleoside-diphosphate-sugar epimerase
MVVCLKIAKGYQIEEIPQVNLPPNKIEKLLHLGFGDLGMRLVHLLNPADYKITAICRSPREHNFDHLEIYNGDLFQQHSFTEILQQPFDVIVLSMTPAARSLEAYQQAYVQTCDYLVNRLRSVNWRPRLILFVSSTSVYGQSMGEWINETSPAHPTKFNGNVLLQAEKLIGESDLPVCVVRFSGIYGPGRNRLIDQIKTGNLSASQAYTNRIHVNDCARVLAHLIQKQKQEKIESLYLASDSCPASLNEIHLWLAAQLGIKNPVISGEDKSKGKRIDSQRLLQSGFSFLYADYKQGYSSLLTD